MDADRQLLGSMCIGRGKNPLSELAALECGKGGTRKKELDTFYNGKHLLQAVLSISMFLKKKRKKEKRDYGNKTISSAV